MNRMNSCHTQHIRSSTLSLPSLYTLNIYAVVCEFATLKAGHFTFTDQTTIIGSSNLSKLNQYLLSEVYGPEGSASEASSEKFPLRYLPRNRKFITLAIIEKEGIN